MSGKQMINDMNMQQQNCSMNTNQIENKPINSFNAGINIQSVNVNQAKNDVNNISCQKENDILSMANDALLMAKQTCDSMNMNTQKVVENTSNYTAIQDIKKLLEKVIVNIAELNNSVQNSNQDCIINNVVMNSSNSKNKEEAKQECLNESVEKISDNKNIEAENSDELEKQAESVEQTDEIKSTVQIQNVQAVETAKIDELLKLNELTNVVKNLNDVNKELLPVVITSKEIVLYDEIQKEILEKKLKEKEEEYNKVWRNDIFSENEDWFKLLLDISDENMTDNLRKKLANRENKAKIMMEEKSKKIFNDFSDNKIDEIKNYILKIAARSTKILSMYDIQKYIGYYKKEVNARAQIIITIYAQYPELFDEVKNVNKVKNYVLDKLAFEVLSTITVKNVENWIENYAENADNNEYLQNEVIIKTESQQIIEKILNKNRRILGDFDYASEIQIIDEIIIKNKKCKNKKITLEYIEAQIDKALEETYIQPLSKQGRKRKTSALLNKYNDELFGAYDEQTVNRIKTKVINKSMTNAYAITFRKIKQWFNDAYNEVKRENIEKEIEEITELITEKFKFVGKLEKNIKDMLAQDYKEGNIGLDEISRKEFDNYVFDKVIKTGETSNKRVTNFIKESFNIQIEKENEYATLVFEKIIELKSKNLNLNFNITNKNDNYWSKLTSSLFITNNTIKWEDRNELFYVIGQMLCSIMIEKGKIDNWEDVIFSVRNYYRDEERNLKMNKKLRKIRKKNEKETLNQVLTKFGCRTKEQFIKYLIKDINSKIGKEIDSRAITNIGLNMSEVCHMEKLIENPKSVNLLAKQELKRIANNYYDEIWNIYNGNYNMISEIIDAIFLGRNDIYRVFIPRGKGRVYYEKNHDGSDRKYSEILDVQFYEIISWYNAIKIVNNFEAMDLIDENFGEKFCDILDQTVEKYFVETMGETYE